MNWYWQQLGIKNKGWKRIIILIHIVVFIVNGFFFGAYGLDYYEEKHRKNIKYFEIKISNNCDYYNNIELCEKYKEDLERHEKNYKKWRMFSLLEFGIFFNFLFIWTVNVVIMNLRSIYLWVSRGFKES